VEEFSLITISLEEAGKRLDLILKERFPFQSRTYFQFLIERGAVHLNNTIPKKRIKPKVDDTVTVEFLFGEEMACQPEELAFDILYEDEEILAINKAAGMVVHPAPGHLSGTVANGLLFHCQRVQSSSARPGIVHRLDKETSGVLLLAKTEAMERELSALFASRSIVKRYLALCMGKGSTLNEETIDLPIGRHPTERQKMAVLSGGKPARSHFKALATAQGVTLFGVLLETGRTHQIRVHAKERGFPVLGDTTYGSSSFNAKYGASRQMLHASSVEFTHPRSKETVRITAPLPPDFTVLLQKIGVIPFPENNFIFELK